LKYKIIVLILLVAVLAGIFAVKSGNGRIAGDSTRNIDVSRSSVSLIEQARQKGQPAWLLFHSTT